MPKNFPSPGTGEIMDSLAAADGVKELCHPGQCLHEIGRACGSEACL